MKLAKGRDTMTEYYGPPPPVSNPYEVAEKHQQMSLHKAQKNTLRFMNEASADADLKSFIAAKATPEVAAKVNAFVAMIIRHEHFRCMMAAHEAVSGVMDTSDDLSDEAEDAAIAAVNRITGPIDKAIRNLAVREPLGLVKLD